MSDLLVSGEKPNNIKLSPDTAGAKSFRRDAYNCNPLNITY